MVSSYFPSYSSFLSYLLFLISTKQRITCHSVTCLFSVLAVCRAAPYARQARCTECAQLYGGKWCEAHAYKLTSVCSAAVITYAGVTLKYQTLLVYYAASSFVQSVPLVHVLRVVLYIRTLTQVFTKVSNVTHYL